MEAGLAKMLAEYRHWAGRLVTVDATTGKRAILLNDAGARLVEALADVALADVMPLEPTPEALHLHPSISDDGGAEGTTTTELMLVQVTRFRCGSFAVGTPCTTPSPTATPPARPCWHGARPSAARRSTPRPCTTGRRCPCSCRVTRRSSSSSTAAPSSSQCAAAESKKKDLAVADDDGDEGGDADVRLISSNWPKGHLT